MPINLHVGSEFDEDAARRTKAEAQAYYKQQAVALEVKAKLKEKTLKEVSDEARIELQREVNTLRVDAILNRDSAVKVVREFEAELKAQRKPKIEVETKIDRDSISRAMRGMESDVKAVETRFQGLTNLAEAFTSKIEQMGLTSTRGLGAGGPLVVAGLVGALYEVVGVAASAAQSIALLPAVAGAAGVAMGTLALATSGFGAAMKNIGDPKKFAEDLASLSPSAQQAALSIQSIMPALTELKNATQDAFMANFAQGINRLANQYLPSIKNLTTGVASAFNQALSGIGDQLMASGTQGSIQTFINNIVEAFRQLAPAAAPFAKALADIMSVGSSFLPGLAKSVADAATAFAQFIQNAKQSGELKQFMSEGLDTVKQLAGAAYDLARAFMSLAPVGRDVLPDMLRVLKEVENVLPMISATAMLIGPSFGAWEVALAPIEGMIKAISTAWDAVASHVIPVINQITAAINTMIEPIRYIASLAGITIPDIPAMRQPGSEQWGGQGPTRSENRTSRPGPLPTAGLPGVPGGGYPLTGAPGAGGTGGVGHGAFGVATAPPKLGPSWGPAGGGPLSDPTQTVKTPLDTGPSISSSAPTSTGGSGSSTPSAPPTPSITTPSVVTPSSYPGGYPGDAALLAGVPAGKYDSSGDLSKGLGDCSSAIEDLVNILEGRSTAGRSMSTGNEAQWLTQHGFLPGMGGPGDFRVGFNAWHTQATLPGGTPFNWGSDAAAARRGIGGTGADDPAFTSHFYRPVGAIGGSNGLTTPGGSGALGAPVGGGIPVYVVNFDQMMRGGSGTPGGPGGVGTGAGNGLGTGGGGAGGFDPLGAMFSGLQQGGGWGGVAGSIGSGVMGLIRSLGGGAQTFDWGGELQPGITLAQNNTGKPEKITAPGAPGGSGPLGPGGSSHPAGQAGQDATRQGPSRIGGGEPKAQPGSGESGGGLVGAATGAAAMAADMFAPGSGAAVQILSQEAQRAIKFGSQALAIGAGGLLDTFLPFGGSDLAQNNWITKVGGSFAGVQAQIPNTAGKSASVDQMNRQGQGPGIGGAAGQTMPPPVSSGRGSGPAPGPGGPAVVNHITYNNNGQANAPTLNDVSGHLVRQYDSVAGRR